ncbi:hypothetical protein CP980_00345 [Streptomyces vinaceus]|uniref:Uncharacterized protein n=1 Tax=Streptomyces vinaceus TaxID=1960 RepID=A0A5J6J8B5_STRVI|nr:hypothetical protein CP980_00345 [Streptomyces vinaceus]
MVGTGNWTVALGTTRFADILADVVPWLETFCEPVEAKASGDVYFWVRDLSALRVRAFDPADVGVFFLSEDEEMPAGAATGAAPRHRPAT